MATDLSPSTSIINAYLQGLKIRRQKEQFEQGLEQRKTESESRLKVAETQAKSLADYRQAMTRATIASEQARQTRWLAEQKRERMEAAGTAIGEGSFQPPFEEILSDLPTGESVGFAPEPQYQIDIPEAIRQLGIRFGTTGPESRSLLGTTAGPEARARLEAREKGLEASAVAQAKIDPALELLRGKEAITQPNKASVEAQKQRDRVAIANLNNESREAARRITAKARIEAKELDLEAKGVIDEKSIEGWLDGLTWGEVKITEIPAAIRTQTINMMKQLGRTIISPKKRGQLDQIAETTDIFLTQYDAFLEKHQNAFPSEGFLKRKATGIYYDIAGEASDVGADLKPLTAQKLILRPMLGGEDTSRFSERDAKDMDAFMPSLEMTFKGSIGRRNDMGALIWRKWNRYLDASRMGKEQRASYQALYPRMRELTMPRKIPEGEVKSKPSAQTSQDTLITPDGTEYKDTPANRKLIQAKYPDYNLNFEVEVP